jgi:tRNA (guanine37-N1)-methyltransferase
MGLKDQLAGRLPAAVLPFVSDHFDVIGDVAVLTVPAELEPYRHLVAEAVVSRRKNISTVLEKKEKANGDSRTARYGILLGGRTVTLHRECGFVYRLDVSRVFFSTRMAHERKRVTDQIRPGERVFVPFAGVGPFAIPAAARGAMVVAVEKNPDAVGYLSENIALNHVNGNCHVLQGDAFDTESLPYHEYDRVIIPAPYGMDHALGAFLPLLGHGGMVHLYTFRVQEQIPSLISAYEGKGLMVTHSSPCGNVAPGVSRWVFDMVRRQRTERMQRGWGREQI